MPSKDQDTGEHGKPARAGLGRAMPEQKGRGAAHNPANRFDRLELPWEPEWLEHERVAETRGWRAATEFFEDTSKSVLSENNSPDLGFRWSLNPYRGCEHGCSYCYARPSHEYLGYSAGLDFESRIMVKRDAPALLEQKLRSRNWRPEPILLSGNTDCYQPVERRLGLTRACLAVLLGARHPVLVITKNHLVLRDLDLLKDLAADNLVSVTISVTTLDPALASAMEPRASTPSKRLEAIAGLAQAGVPVRVNTAPLIPGLNDHEVPAILAEAAARGAGAGNYILLRLPHGLKELFVDWLERNYPASKDKVLNAIRQARGGRLSDPRFGVRMRGEGPRADAIAKLFDLTCRRLGLERALPELETGLFRRPESPPEAPSPPPGRASRPPAEPSPPPAQGELFDRP